MISDVQGVYSGICPGGWKGLFFSFRGATAPGVALNPTKTMDFFWSRGVSILYSPPPFPPKYASNDVHCSISFDADQAHKHFFKI